jgi:DNA-binding response OmpR family regulator
MEASQGICPCCGGTIADGAARFESATLTSLGHSVTFTSYQSKIFALLWAGRSTGRVVSKSRMFQELYALDPNGGPDLKVLDVMICRIRRVLRRTEFEIVNIHNEGFFLRTKNRAAARRVISTERLESCA